MAKKNPLRKVIRLVNPATGTAFYTTKNQRNANEKQKGQTASASSGKLVLRKYDKKIRAYATFTEVKKNLGRNEVKQRKH